jgi:hypothetical protein
VEALEAVLVVAHLLVLLVQELLAKVMLAQ